MARPDGTPEPEATAPPNAMMEPEATGRMDATPEVSEDAPRLRILRAGLTPYPDALAWQDRLLADRQAGLIPDTLLLLQHPPTFTYGARPRPEHLLASPEELDRLGIGVHHVRRGGDITYHGPGQVVGYAFVDLAARKLGVHPYVRGLEETIIQALRPFGIAGERSAGQTGVWVGAEKIAAIGVEVKRWVTRHGFALNVNPDLSHFGLIVPCGIADKGVTSMERLLGAAPPMAEVEEALVAAFRAVFGYE